MRAHRRQDLLLRSVRRAASTRDRFVVFSAEWQIEDLGRIINDRECPPARRKDGSEASAAAEAAYVAGHIADRHRDAPRSGAACSEAEVKPAKQWLEPQRPGRDCQVARNVARRIH